MKYSKKTLEELKKIVDRAIALGDITNHEDIRNYLNVQSGNPLLSNDKREYAADLAREFWQLYLLPEKARNISRKIQALIDGTSAYAPQDEREIEQFISDLKGKSNNLSQAADNYFLWADNDSAPKYQDAAWPIYNFSKDLSEVVSNLETLQQADGILSYREADEEFAREMKYLNAMSSDGLALTEVPDELAKVKKELQEARNKLNHLSSPAGLQEWRDQYAHATLRVKQIPEQLDQYRLERDRTRERIQKDKNALEAVQRAHREYLSIPALLEKDRKSLDEKTHLVNLKIKENERLHAEAKEDMYERQLDSYKNRANNRELFNKYLEVRERELRWKKANKLVEQLIKVIENDSIAQTILFARAEQRAKKFLGIQFKARQAGIPQKYLDDLEKSIREVPARAERLDQGRALIDSIMEVAPDKAKIKELLEKIPGQDENQYFLNMRNGLDELINAAHNEAVSNPAYGITQSLNKNLSRLKDEYQKTIEKDSENVDRIIGLTKEIASAQTNIADNAFNSDEVDDLLDRHIASKDMLAKADEELEDLKREQADLQNSVQYYEKRLPEIRKEVVEKYSRTYRILKEHEKDAPEGEKASDQVLNEMAGDNAEKADEVFDRLEEEIGKQIESDTKNAEQVIPRATTLLDSELFQEQRKVEEYSFENYKKEVVNAQIRVTELTRKHNRLDRMNQHLNKAKDLYNKRAESINQAADVLDHEREEILRGIDNFSKNFDKNKKPNHDNSEEYKAIKQALDRFTREAVMAMSPEELKTNLTTLKNAASEYKSKKNKEMFRWIPSSQRKFRLSQSDAIEHFADAHTSTINAMGLDAKTMQAMADAKEGRFAEIRDNETFAEKAQQIKGEYRDDAVKTFSGLVNEMKTSYSEKVNGEFGNMSEEGKREVIKDALVSNALEQKLWDFDPEEKNLDKHNLELKELKRQVSQNVEKDNKALIEQAVKNSKKVNLTGSDIARRKDRQEAGKIYNGLISYDQQVKQVIDENIKDAVNNNRPILPGGLH